MADGRTETRFDGRVFRVGEPFWDEEGDVHTCEQLVVFDNGVWEGGEPYLREGGRIWPVWRVHATEADARESAGRAESRKKQGG